MTSKPPGGKPQAKIVNPYLSKPKVVNPYAKKKPAQLSQQQTTVPSQRNPTVPLKVPTASAAKPAAKPEPPAKKSSEAATDKSKVKNVLPTKPNVDSKMQPRPAAASSSLSGVPRPASTLNTGVRAMGKKKNLSLKQKLLMEMKNIRHATELERQQKQLRKEQKALEKQRREQERLQAIEEEKRRKQQQEEEERRRKIEEEQERLRQERLKLEQERQRQLEEMRQKKLEEEQRQRMLLLQKQEQLRREAGDNLNSILTIMRHYHESLTMMGPGPHNDQQTAFLQEIRKKADLYLPKSHETQQYMMAELQRLPPSNSSMIHEDRMRLLALLNQRPVTNLSWEDILMPASSMYPLSQQQHFLFSMAAANPYNYIGQPNWNHNAPRLPMQPLQAHSKQSVSQPLQGGVYTPAQPLAGSTTNVTTAPNPAALGPSRPVVPNAPDEKTASNVSTNKMDPKTPVSAADTSVDHGPKPTQKRSSIGMEDSVAKITDSFGNTESQTTMPIKDAQATGTNSTASAAPMDQSAFVTGSYNTNAFSGNRPQTQADIQQSPDQLIQNVNPSTQPTPRSQVHPETTSPGPREGTETQQLTVPLRPHAPQSSSVASPILSEPASAFSRSLTTSQTPVAAPNVNQGLHQGWNPYQQSYGYNAMQPWQALANQGYHHPQYNGGQYYPQATSMHPISAAYPWQQQVAGYSPYSQVPGGGMLPWIYYNQYFAMSRQIRPQVPRAPRPRKPKPPLVQCLAFEPVSSPSPYAYTHIVLTQTFVMQKKPGESFGLTLKEDTQSILVELAWFDENLARIKKATAPSDKLAGASTGEIVPTKDATKEEATAAIPPSTDSAKMDESQEVRNEAVRAPSEMKESEPSTTVPATTQMIDVTIGSPKQPSESKAKEGNCSQVAPVKDAVGEVCSQKPEQQQDSSPDIAPTPPPTVANGDHEIVQPTNNTPGKGESGSIAATRPATQEINDGKGTGQMHLDEAEKPKQVDPTSTPATADAESSKSGEQGTQSAPSSAPWKLLDQNQAQPSKPKRPRRKRQVFAVMMVVDASQQNQRIDSSMHLQPGDIILAVNGVSIGGQIFKEACTLFSSGCVEKEDEDGNKIALCSITIARKKPPPPPIVKPLPFLSIPAVETAKPIQAITSIEVKPLTDKEIKIFADCVMRALQDPQRMLGAGLTDDLLRKVVAISPELNGQNLLELKTKWSLVGQTAERECFKTSAEHWSREWQKEREKHPITTPMKFLTDAKRALMRASPRPMKGCRCGSKEHEFVNHANCPLYSDILVQTGKSRESHQQKKRKKKDDDSRQLGTVEAAFKERFLKQQAEKKALEEEAAFVEEMEEAQVQILRKAVFAPPSLTTMVLSAVFELQSKFPKEEVEETISVPSPEDTAMQDASKVEENATEEDDDEDVPLAALGKREGSCGSSSNKKQKVETSISIKFLAAMLKLVAARWGHLYREQDDVDYAWRWESFHGQTETNGRHWESQSTNPRKAGTTPFENLRFLLTDEFMSALESKDPSSEAKANRAKVVLSYFLDPQRTGLLDELLALVNTRVLNLKCGIPRPSSDWTERVDLLLLNEMQGLWSPDADESGKFMVSNKMRKKLYKKWEVTEYGWSLRDEPDQLIFDFDEWEEWRRNFEERQEEKAADSEGIAKFGTDEFGL